LFFIIACRNYFNFGSAVLVRFLAQEARSKKQETLKKPEYLITIALAQLLRIIYGSAGSISELGGLRL
jgi:hypothetical protein